MINTLTPDNKYVDQDGALIDPTGLVSVELNLAYNLLK